MKYLLLISLLFTTGLFADFKVGDRLPNITLQDQFEHEMKVEITDTMVIMAFEKDVSVHVNEFLKTKEGTFLATHHSKYISDISTMPSFITSMFALPKMKKYPFSLMLIEDDFGMQFNQQDGKITVYTLKKYKIRKIEFLNPKMVSSLFSK